MVWERKAETKPDLRFPPQNQPKIPLGRTSGRLLSRSSPPAKRYWIGGLMYIQNVQSHLTPCHCACNADRRYGGVWACDNPHVLQVNDRMSEASTHPWPRQPSGDVPGPWHARDGAAALPFAPQHRQGTQGTISIQSAGSGDSCLIPGVISASRCTDGRRLPSCIMRHLWHQADLICSLCT